MAVIGGVPCRARWWREFSRMKEVGYYFAVVVWRRGHVVFELILFVECFGYGCMRSRCITDG